MTLRKRYIRQQRRESARMWELPDPGPDAREQLGDVLEDVFRALAEDRQAKQVKEGRSDADQA